MKRQIGIRNIKIKGKKVQFNKGSKFKYTKNQAKETQEFFQTRGHLTRIIPKKEKIGRKTHHGYYVWYSEKRIRERGLKW